MKIKVRDLIKECHNRPTKSLCDACPYKEKCEFLKERMRNACPCSYFEILEGNI